MELGRPIPRRKYHSELISSVYFYFAQGKQVAADFELKASFDPLWSCSSR